MAEEPAMITFAPGAVGAGPLRLPLLGGAAAWFAFDKPAGPSVFADSVEPDAPPLEPALAAAARAGKRQLLALGATAPAGIHFVDAEISGAVVFAKSPRAAAALRNSLGSQQWGFVYDLVAEAGEMEDAITCDLPLARHSAQPRMVVSHRTGKKCRTEFRRVSSLGRHALWEARTAGQRPHQVRLHAAESGLRIPGEQLYGRVSRVYLSSLKRGYRGDRRLERPLHPGVAVHLREIVFPDPESNVPVRIVAPRPRSFEALLRQLAAAARPAPGG